MDKKFAPIIRYPGHHLLLRDIVRADNCHLYDSRGKKYVDLESGVWCTSAGHSHPRVIRAMTEQAGLIAHNGFNYSSAVVESAAYEILSLLEFDGGQCVFLCSGSEAVEYGVRVAQMMLPRPLLMTMTDSYFGAYGAAFIKEASGWFCFDWQPCAGCPDSVECNRRCKYWAQIPFDRIGGFLFEPGSSSGMVRFPPSKLIISIVGVIRQNAGLIFINEVTTGIGRTGRWFGYQHYGLTPDIVAVGKGIGSGYPVSVVAFSSETIKRLGDREVKYAQSHQNDPLGAAVALEVIRIIRDENLLERCRDISSRLIGGLERIKIETGKIREIRHRGLLVALELMDSPENSFTVRIHEELIKRGFIVGRRPGTSVLRIDPPLTINTNDIEAFLAALGDILIE